MGIGAQPIREPPGRRAVVPVIRGFFGGDGGDKHRAARRHAGGDRAQVRQIVVMGQPNPAERDHPHGEQRDHGDSDGPRDPRRHRHRDHSPEQQKPEHHHEAGIEIEGAFEAKGRGEIQTGQQQQRDRRACRHPQSSQYHPGDQTAADQQRRGDIQRQRIIHKRNQQLRGLAHRGQIFRVADHLTEIRGQVESHRHRKYRQSEHHAGHHGLWTAPNLRQMGQFVRADEKREEQQPHQVAKKQYDRPGYDETKGPERMAFPPAQPGRGQQQCHPNAGGEIEKPLQKRRVIGDQHTAKRPPCPPPHQRPTIRNRPHDRQEQHHPQHDPPRHVHGQNVQQGRCEGVDRQIGNDRPARAVKSCQNRVAAILRQYDQPRQMVRIVQQGRHIDDQQRRQQCQTERRAAKPPDPPGHNTGGLPHRSRHEQPTSVEQGARHDGLRQSQRENNRLRGAGLGHGGFQKRGLRHSRRQCAGTTPRLLRLLTQEHGVNMTNMARPSVRPRPAASAPLPGTPPRCAPRRHPCGCPTRNHRYGR